MKRMMTISTLQFCNKLETFKIKSIFIKNKLENEIIIILVYFFMNILLFNFSIYNENTLLLLNEYTRYISGKKLKKILKKLLKSLDLHIIVEYNVSSQSPRVLAISKNMVLAMGFGK